MHQNRLNFVELEILKICMSNHLCNLLLRPRLIIQVVSNAIARFVMLVKTLYFPIDVLSVLLQVKVTKLDNTCLVGLILSFIVLFVKKCNRQCVGSAIDFRRRLSNYNSHIKKQKRTCRLVKLQLENKFKMLENDMYMAGIGPAVLELLSFKVVSGSHQRGITLVQEFWKIFGNMRPVSPKMTSHLTSHNFQLLKIEIFSMPCKV